MIPNVYDIKPVQFLQSYDYLDLASGRGYKDFYLGFATDTVSEKNIIFDKTFDADPRYKLWSDNNVANALRFDLDFDINFVSNPSTTEGDFIFNLTQRALGGGGGQTGNIYAVINIYHVTVGGTETSIGTAQTVTTSSSAASYIHERKALKINTALRYYGIGEKLRINVLIYTSHVGIGITNGLIWFDPTQIDASAAASGDLPTDFIVRVPFKIDL